MSDKPKQTSLDRRDKRRARALLRAAKWERCTYDDLVAPIAAALKRERQNTGMAALQWFLFSDRKERQRVKRVIQAEEGKGKR